MNWKGIPKDFNIKDWEGFVYKISYKKGEEYYIGKKSFWKKIRKKPLKKKKKVRISKVESDWKEYNGSSQKFKDFMEKKSVGNFRKKILHFCKSKSEMSYKELIEQINHDVLNDKNSFNGMINVRLNRTR